MSDDEIIEVSEIRVSAEGADRELVRDVYEAFVEIAEMIQEEGVGKLELAVALALLLERLQGAERSLRVH
jgi:hypothetical protein